MSCQSCGGKPSTFCFTEGVAYCEACNASAHAAGSAGASHDAVAATPWSQPPQCDICRCAPAMLLCTDDRAVMCRGCDTTVHGANEATAKHLRLPLPQFSLGFKALSSSSGGGGGEKEDKGAAAASAAAAAAATEAKGKGRAASPEQQAKAAAAAAQAALLQQRASAQAAAAQRQQQQQQQANGNGDNNPYGDLWAPSAPGMTLAAELLGLPPDAVGDFSAKDVDAAYMLADAEDGGTDFDADLSAILEVPDIDFLPPPPAAAGGGGASGSGGALPPPPVPQAFYSSNDNGAGPSNAPAPPAGGGGGGGGGRGSRRGGGGGGGANGGGGGGGEVDGVVPELLPKRARR